MSEIVSLLTDENVSIAKSNGVNRRSLYVRLHSGWKLEDAINTPPIRKSVMTTVQRQAAKENGIDLQVVYRRIKKGWDIDDAVSYLARRIPRKENEFDKMEFSGDQLYVMKKNGLTIEVVKKRLADGWVLFDALIHKGES